LKLSIFVLAAGLLSACTSLAIITNAPYYPGDTLFPIQRFLEEEISPLLLENTSRTVYYLELSDRRTNQLIDAQGTENELTAFFALDKSLDKAVDAVLGSPQHLKPAINYRLIAVLENAYDALTLLKQVPVQAPEAYQQVLDEILSVYTALTKSYEKPTGTGMESQNQALPTDETINDDTDNLSIPYTIEFPPGSEGAAHEFFLLSGEHAELVCESCHLEGKFAGTPAQCQTCHLSDQPANHYSGECAACHTAQGWPQVNFNHKAAGATNCLACHSKKKPASHFEGQCSTCHNTSVWRQVSFSHNGLTDCQSCHDNNKPANHFAGKCSTCHNSNSWRSVSMNHSGLTDCLSCHSDDKPANHYSGQCSTCHNTGAWSSASFSHSGQTDCQSCHSSDRPANHYSGQCSACHTTSSWGSASFGHSGQTDCQSCHSNDRPANHYSGQCSACHITNSWGSTSFSHSGQTDCQSCHSRPASHWSGQCSQCHTTNSWGSISVQNHSFPIDHKNANGICSNCHNDKSAGWTCYNCHDRAKMEEKHAEKNISDIASRCINCHPNGKD
jgi:hypothetical protein